MPTEDPAPQATSPTEEIAELRRQLAEVREREGALEAALRVARESEARFRMMADSAPFMLWTSGPEGLGDYINRQWAEFTGRTLEQERGQGWAEGVHPDDRDSSLATYLAALQERQPFQLEYRLRRADGTWRWVLSQGAPRIAPDGTFLGYVGSAVDITERRDAERRLAEFSRDFEHLLEQTGDNLYAKDLDYRFRFASQTIANATGHAHWRELVGKRDADVFPAAQVAAYRVEDEQIIRDRRPIIGKLDPFIGADGSAQIIETNKWPQFDGSGELIGFMGISRLVTERENAARLLRESEARYRAVLDGLQEGMVIQAATREIVAANPAAQRILGLSFEQLSGRTSLDPRWKARHEDGSDFPGQEHPVMVTLATGRPLTGVRMRVSRPSGEEALIEINSVPIFGESGSLPSAAVGTFVDITARRAAEVALVRARERYQTLMALAWDGIHLVDVEGRLVEANPAFLKSLGYSEDEAVSLQVADWSAGLSADQVRGRINEILQHPETFEDQHRRRDGTVFDVEVSAAGVTLEGQVYLLAISRDVSERKRVQRQLNETLRNLEERVQHELALALEKDRLLVAQSRLAAMGEMVGNIAHQWRQPLNALAVLLTNLREESLAGPLTAERLAALTTDADRLICQMSTTISDFVGFFRPDKHPAAFSVRQRVQETIALVAASFAYHGVRIILEPGDEAMTVGVPNEYGQVVLNLLSNAREAIGDRGVEDGRIVVRITREERSCIVTVADNGGGVGVFPVDRIFEPYFTTKGAGTGLGLHMSRMIVERSFGGTLSVENTATGAAFSITTSLAEPDDDV